MCSGFCCVFFSSLRPSPALRLRPSRMTCISCVFFYRLRRQCVYSGSVPSVSCFCRALVRLLRGIAIPARNKRQALHSLCALSATATTDRYVRHLLHSLCVLSATEPRRGVSGQRPFRTCFCCAFFQLLRQVASWILPERLAEPAFVVRSFSYCAGVRPLRKSRLPQPVFVVRSFSYCAKDCAGAGALDRRPAFVVRSFSYCAGCVIPTPFL